MKKIILVSCVLVSYLSNAQDFNIQYRSNVPYPGYTCSSEWAYVTPDGTEYALVGTSFGVSIVDISNPDSPKVKFNVIHTGSFWREIKTYGHYAYATNESGGGVLIIDLSALPDTFYQYSFIYTDTVGTQQYRAHELWIDENGRLYLFGGNYMSGGATIFDLTQDPLNPPFLGKYEGQYIHSGFVRGDTLWASEISAGQVEVINFSDPANPVVMASFHTPSNFTHNSWPTHDNHYLFTTDEVSGAYVTSYDVSNLSNINELDRAQSFPGTSVIPHNVHLLNDTFAVTAYYCDGVIIFDVLHPDNMIKVASFDSYLDACGGYNGTWGAYPYLPSGNLILSNIEGTGGLFVLTPAYIQACRVEGIVTDSITGTLLNGVSVDILNTEASTVTDLSGVYKTGIAAAGNYLVRFTKAGYASRIISVPLQNGVVTSLNVKMYAGAIVSLNGTIADSASSNPIPFAHLELNNLLTNVEADADGSGNFTVGSIANGDYIATIGKWSHITRQVIASVNGSNLLLKIPEGYYDDFFFDEGWTVSSTATTGMWTRGEPKGTPDGNGGYLNPEFDVDGDFGDQCYVTGNGGGSISFDDVDEGYTQISSPIFDATSYINPKVSYDYWLAVFGASGPNDSLVVYLSNGTQTVLVKIYTSVNTTLKKWNHDEFAIEDYLTPSTNMSLIAYAVDAAPENVLEAGLDKFQVTGDVGTVSENILVKKSLALTFPNPFSARSTLQYDLSSSKAKEITVQVFNLVGQMEEEHSASKLKGQMNWGSSLQPGMYLVKILVDGKLQQVLSAVKD